MLWEYAVMRNGGAGSWQQQTICGWFREFGWMESFGWRWSEALLSL